VSCIIGLVDNGHVYMGAKSACMAPWDGGPNIATPKVFRNGPFIMAGCGRLRDLQILEHTFAPPQKYQDQDDMAFMCTSFTKALRTCMRDNGSLTTYRSAEYMDSSFIVGFNGVLFVASTDFAILKVTDTYITDGSGWAFAAGSLHGSEGLCPKDRITRALDAAAKYNQYVRPPFTIVSDTDDEG